MIQWFIAKHMGKTIIYIEVYYNGACVYIYSIYIYNKLHWDYILHYLGLYWYYKNVIGCVSYTMVI